MTFGKTSFSKEWLFRVLIALIFFRGTVVFGSSYCQRGSIWSIKTPKHHLESSAFYIIVSFYLKRGVATGHSIFWPYWLLLEDHLEPTIFSQRMIFYRSSCSHAFFQGLCGTDNFWKQLLIKNSYFFGSHILGIRFF